MRSAAEIMTAVKGIGLGLPVPITADQVLHEIKDQDYVKHALWVAIDQGIIRIKWFTPLIEQIATAAHWAQDNKWADLDDEGKASKTLEFYLRHAYFELVFFGAWRAYRVGAEGPLIRSSAMALTYIPDDPMVKTLMYLREHPGEFPEGLPTLQMREQKVITHLQRSFFPTQVDTAWL